MMALSFFFFEVRQRGPQGRGTTDGHLKKVRRHSQYYIVRGHVHYIPICSLSLLVSCVSRGQDWIARYDLDF